jgi:hypothetical protein
MQVLALAAFIALPIPINPDVISLNHARTLEGCLVMATFIAGKPASSRASLISGFSFSK